MEQAIDKIIDALDQLPVATLVFVFSAIGGLYALIRGDITYEEFSVSLGVLGGGTAGIGYVRNKAGKGLASYGVTKRSQRP